jgi:hypothetical protein
MIRTLENVVREMLPEATFSIARVVEAYRDLFESCW